MEIVACRWDDTRLEAVGRSDEGDSRAALAQGVGDCNRRIEMPAGSPACEDDGHVFSRGLRALPTFAISATAMQLTTSELPPNEMNGSGTPVTGHDDETTPILMKA